MLIRDDSLDEGSRTVLGLGPRERNCYVDGKTACTVKLDGWVKLKENQSKIMKSEKIMFVTVSYLFCAESTVLSNSRPLNCTYWSIIAQPLINYVS